MKITTRILERKEEELLADVQYLGDKNRSTLGFLPGHVFKKSASERKIICALNEDNILCGYLLFRITQRSNSAFIVHLCINDDYRGKQVSKALLEHLFTETRNQIGVGLSCRNDYYYANRIWPKFGFIDLKERPGRSKEKLPLTFWWRENRSLVNLFTGQNNIPNRLTAFVDYCVVNDIFDDRNDESKGLIADWIKDEVELYVSAQLFSELSRGPEDYLLKNRKRRLVQSKFLVATESSDKKINEVWEKLKEEYLPKRPSEASDLKHLAIAIYHDANYFITQDRLLISKVKNIGDNYAIEVITPGEFISKINEQTNVFDYQPYDISSNVIEVRKFTATDISCLENFQNHITNESLESIRKTLRKFIANPMVYDCELFLDKTRANKPVGLIVTSRQIEKTELIHLLRFAPDPFINTVARNILYKLLQRGLEANAKTIHVIDIGISNNTSLILQEFKFILNSDGSFEKAMLRGMLSKKDFAQQINEKSKIDINSSDIQALEAFDLERYFWPLKITDVDIPCYLIPIQPNWAKRLFDESTNEMFPHDRPDLILNRENVYYKSARQSMKPFSRILWYVSKDKTGEIHEIRACSYVTEVTIGTASQIFKMHQKLGIYNWEDVKKISDKDANGKVLAFKFVDTELFKKPIGYKLLTQIYKGHKNISTTIPTTVAIDNALYMKLYGKGMGI